MVESSRNEVVSLGRNRRLAISLPAAPTVTTRSVWLGAAVGLDCRILVIRPKIEDFRNKNSSRWAGMGRLEIIFPIDRRKMRSPTDRAATKSRKRPALNTALKLPLGVTLRRADGKSSLDLRSAEIV